MFPLELKECGVNEQQILKSLVKLYSYDVSEVAGWRLDHRGVFEISSEPAFSADELRSYLIQVEGEPAGFATVAERSFLEPTKKVWDMHQFFVLRKFRGQGIGTRVSHLLFDLHPGQWEVREYGADREAQRFWRSAIHSYTRGQYGEMLVQNEVWHGPVQRFISSTSDIDALFGTEDRGIHLERREDVGERPITLRRARLESELEKCGEIIKRLPEWTSAQESLSKRAKELKELPTFIAEENDVVVGFVTLHHRNPYTSSIQSLAVTPECEGESVGKALLEFAENEARERGAELLEVKVTGDDDKLYLDAGYRPLDAVTQDEVKCLLLVKSLG